MDERDVIDARLSNLIGVATGGDTLPIEKFLERAYGNMYPPSRDEVLDILAEAGVPRWEILIEDINRILRGEEARYFVPSSTLVDRYRRRHGLYEASEDDVSIEDYIFGPADMSQGLMDLIERTCLAPREPVSKAAAS